MTSQLMNKPVRSDFETEEEFEEALGWWMTHQGRILALRSQQAMRAQVDQVEAWGRKMFDRPTESQGPGQPG
jgi:hypothetical protein